jgi:hypothetical protein
MISDRVSRDEMRMRRSPEFMVECFVPKQGGGLARFEARNCWMMIAAVVKTACFGKARKANDRYLASRFPKAFEAVESALMHK